MVSKKTTIFWGILWTTIVVVISVLVIESAINIPAVYKQEVAHYKVGSIWPLDSEHPASIRVRQVSYSIGSGPAYLEGDLIIDAPPGAIVGDIRDDLESPACGPDNNRSGTKILIFWKDKETGELKLPVWVICSHQQLKDNWVPGADADFKIEDIQIKYP